MRTAAFVVLAGLAGCSLSSEGLGTEDPFTGDSAPAAADSSVALDDTAAGDETALDSGEPPPLDTSIDTGKPDTSPTLDTAKPDTAPPPDTGPPCVETSCGANPTGAKRIGLVDRTVLCPPGFVTTDLNETRDGELCSCGCATALPPTCSGTGSIPTWYSDLTATCALAGGPLAPMGNGVCSSTGGPAGVGKYFRATPLGVTGGTCNTFVTPDKFNASRPRRLCEAVTCGAAICATPFVECIESATCGGAFPVQRILGTDVSPNCPSCGCTVSGTCAASITLFANTGCTGGTITVAANDACVPVPMGPSTLNSFKYTAGLASMACTPAYMKTKPTSLTVTGQRSLCCRS